MGGPLEFLDSDTIDPSESKGAAMNILDYIIGAAEIGAPITVQLVVEGLKKSGVYVTTYDSLRIGKILLLVANGLDAFIRMAMNGSWLAANVLRWLTLARIVVIAIAMAMVSGG